MRMSKETKHTNDDFREEYIGSVHSEITKRLFSEENDTKEELHKKIKRFFNRKK
jgi:hypothetical protein